MNSKTVFTNLLWRFAERSGAQLVKFCVELILARLLLPDDYGLIALVTVFITISNVFVDSGLGNALIQKKDADQTDFSTVFFFNLIWCLILYGLLFLLAPFIASFFSQPEFSAVLRVLGLQIIISGVKNVQQAYVSKNFMFKKFFFATLGGTIGAAVLGIWMAYQGLGVWALVAQQLFNVTVDTIILWITVKWRPSREFSWNRFKRLFAYGWKLLASSLLEAVYNNIRQLIIGRFYSSGDLAFYNRGRQFPDFITSNVNSSIDSVLLPTLASIQDRREQVKQMTRRAIKTSTYIMAPLMLGLAAVAEPMIRVILTEKWLPALPYLRIFCITFMFYPLHTANLNAIKALGRSDLFLKLEIIKKIIGIVVLILTMKLGVMAMAYSLLFITLTSQIINSWPNRKLLDYGYMEQVKDIIPNIILACMMGIIVYPVKYIEINSLFILLIQIFIGIIIYLAGSFVLKLDTFNYLVEIVKSYIKKRSI